MPELNSPFGYPLVLSLMGMIAWLLVIFFWKKGWLRRGENSRTTPNIHHQEKDAKNDRES